MRPRRLFFRALPIGSQSGLAQECRLRPISFENRDEHARPRRQRKRLFRPDLTFLVDFGFDSWKHGVKSTMLRADMNGKISATATPLTLCLELSGEHFKPVLFNHAQ